MIPKAFWSPIGQLSRVRARERPGRKRQIRRKRSKIRDVGYNPLYWVATQPTPLLKPSDFETHIVR